MKEPWKNFTISSVTSREMGTKLLKNKESKLTTKIIIAVLTDNLPKDEYPRSSHCNNNVAKVLGVSVDHSLFETQVRGIDILFSPLGANERACQRKDHLH